MAQPARETLSRRSWLLAGLSAVVFRLRAAPSFSVFFDGDNLRVSVPQLHFLDGKPLDRLKDGATVVFLSQLTIFRNDRTTVFRRAHEQLVLSYDLWEETFKVTMGDRSAARLSRPAAEAWCLENLAISTLGLEPDRPFWLRFELRAADPKDLAALVGDPGISLRNLIELLGRKPGPDEHPFVFEQGPLRLAGLPRRIAQRSERL
jgi:hypothetical protein